MKDLVASAVARTSTAGGSHLELRLGERPAAIGAEFPVPGLRHPIRSFAAWMVRLGSGSIATQGVIDLSQRRYMMWPPGAELYRDGTFWGGHPGRKVAKPVRSRYQRAEPLLIYDVAQAVTSAQESGTEQVREVSCQMFTCEVDASRVPDEWRSQSSTLQTIVGIDGDGDGYLRRVQVYADDRAWLIELWDFGLNVDELDWSRRPDGVV